MHSLDFISGFPNLYIFQKKSNKTNFGGFLFLIYLIIIISIIVYYIVDYEKNNKYIIQSFTHFNILSEEEIEERNKNVTFNPFINFKFDIHGINEEFNKKIKLSDIKNKIYVGRNTFFRSQVDYNSTGYIVGYECENLKCLSYDNFSKYITEQNNSIKFELKYDGFKLDHQNENKPIIKKSAEENYTFTQQYTLNYNVTTYIDNYWRNILYNEKKFFWEKDYNDNCGYIEYYNLEFYRYGLSTAITINDKHEYVWIKVLGIISFHNEHLQYIEYNRKAISLLDLAANILSLISNIFFVTKIFYQFYSKSFNNYKIIEKLLLNNNEKIKKLSLNKSLELNQNYIDINENSKETLTNNNDNDYLINNTNAEQSESSKLNKKLPKFHFFQFFLNNIYYCLKKYNSQKIIHLYNKIIYKYSSIDSLVRNQILMENLLKDYKWNDPSLNDIENNDLFKQINAYI